MFSQSEYLSSSNLSREIDTEVEDFFIRMLKSWKILQATFSQLSYLRICTRKLNATIISKMATSSDKDAAYQQAQTDLDKVQNSHIDGPGKIFKYILVKVTRKIPQPLKTTAPFPSKYVVRGYLECNYHGDILDILVDSLRKISKDFEVDCTGGGRINHANKKLAVYGYSQGYGKADHQVAVDILKEDYPDYEISWNDEGY